jgi:hypothetical protein
MRRAWTAALVVASVWTASPRPAAAEESHLLVVVGLGGEPKYTDAFDVLATSMVQAAEKKLGLAAARIAYYGEKETDPKVPAYRGRATRENVEKALGGLARDARPGDVVLILLIGHGSFQNGESRFNLPGPDMASTDFAPLLARLAAQRIVLVNTSSASGEWVKTLSGKGRIIVTATRSGMERNETEFAKYFVEAFTDDKADADKDQRVSVLEAFSYARREVERFYEGGHRLLTEHAVLDDDGDGAGTAAGADAKDGAIARTVFLAGGGSGTAAEAAGSADPRLQELQRQRQAVEERLGQLKARKDTMAAAEYEDELEKLLLELARSEDAIRKHGGGR